MHIRRAGVGDLEFLHRMWHTAAFWQPESFVLAPEEALRIPEIAAYIEGWGRRGDLALIAEIGGRPVGAAWYRLFAEDAPGYGFIDADTPELALAVEADTTNPSRRIYQRCGFADVSSDDDSYVMLLPL